MRIDVRCVVLHSGVTAAAAIQIAGRSGDAGRCFAMQRTSLWTVLLLYAPAALLLTIASQATAQSDIAAGDWSVVSAEASEVDAAGPNVGSQPDAPRPVMPAPPPGSDHAASRFHAALGVDYTTAYLSRGLLVEDSGLILQPYADFAVDMYRADDLTVQFTFGTWNSFHGADDATTSDGVVGHWYESDLYAGVAVTDGALELDVRYYFYTSPSGVAGTIEELYFSCAYDDSDLFGAWALNPTAVLAIETGNNAADGGRNGTYLALGVSPGLSFDAGLGEAIEISFPASIGLSLSNYYEGADGPHDVLGFVSVGASASLPLGLDESWGAWTLSAGVQALFLGDAAASFNTNGDALEVIATVGISVEF